MTLLEGGIFMAPELFKNLKEEFITLATQVSHEFDDLFSPEYSEILGSYFKTQKREFNELVKQMREVSEKKRPK